VIGRSVEALFPARFRTVYRKYVARFRRSHKPQIIMGEQSQVIARRKDGAEFPATVSLSKFKIGGKHVFTLLIRDITERKKIAGELHLAVANAKLADKSKIDFLANMSHELRTPLNSIIGFTEMIKGEMMGPFENKIYKGYVNLINESGNHLLSLVNDILDVSKIEAGVMELDEDDVGVADVINLSAKMVRHRAQISGVELTTDIPDDFPLVRADPVRLKQILLNLLDNAIKFTNAGGTVIASASQQHDGGINIQVTDTGIGIAADAIPQVLKPFGQVAEVMQRSQGGSGLGLPLVNSLIELHGGRMQIDSEIGKGTVVTIFLPPERTVAR
jgi:signal transduction histidine kinase